MVTGGNITFKKAIFGKCLASFVDGVLSNNLLVYFI